MNSLLIVYVMVIFFFITLVFGDRSIRACSFIVFTSCILNLLSDNTFDQALPWVEKEKLFIRETNISILWDSCCALILMTSMIFNYESGKQAILLCFAVACHIMVAYGLSGLVRAWYVELIILIGIMQMLVAWNGFRTACRELRKFICRPVHYYRRNSASLSELEEAENQ